jgi:hypothetical protein
VMVMVMKVVAPVSVTVVVVVMMRYCGNPSIPAIKQSRQQSACPGNTCDSGVDEHNRAEC